MPWTVASVSRARFCVTAHAVRVPSCRPDRGCREPPLIAHDAPDTSPTGTSLIAPRLPRIATAQTAAIQRP
jgi:hypothetical protein